MHRRSLIRAAAGLPPRGVQAQQRDSKRGSTPMASIVFGAGTSHTPMLNWIPLRRTIAMQGIPRNFLQTNR